MNPETMKKLAGILQEAKIDHLEPLKLIRDINRASKKAEAFDEMLEIYDRNTVLVEGDVNLTDYESFFDELDSLIEVTLSEDYVKVVDVKESEAD